ncbi:MAG: hypothetical protein Q4G70_10830 [Pseudomonadota bacterium]|nr:hypothetical protein [Pseudomonadota bacterium]
MALIRTTRWLKSVPAFQQYKATTPCQLDQAELRLKQKLPGELRQWLLIMGFGDLSDCIAIREEWLEELTDAPVAGHVVFAQDELGDWLTWQPSAESIWLVSRSLRGYGKLSEGFRAFIEELVDRRFHWQQWTDSLELTPIE